MDLTLFREIDLEQGEQIIEMRSIARVPGPVHYHFELEPLSEDHFSENNQTDRSVIIQGRPTVLYVEGAQGRESYLSNALTAGELDVEVRSARAIPANLQELMRYDFFILSDVAADALSYTQMEAIEQYIRQGGGFLMAGGDHSFGLGGYQGTRIERILPVRLETERRRDQPTLALCLVIDRSGSMIGQKIELAKEAARATAALLGMEDFIEVIGFDEQPDRIVRMQSASNRIGVTRDISRMVARGGTNIFPALDIAYQDLSTTRARIKHVILLTDGQSPEEGIEPLVQVMRAEGITVSTIGLGSDVNRALLTQIASLGHGRSYFTQDPTNVPRIFMRETTAVARSSVVEEYFQPRVVTRADFLNGTDISSSPYLRGYVATQARPAPAQVILESDIGEPILARWRLGLGWSLAWTSDVKNRWAVDWIRWNGFSRFFAQLVKEHLYHDHTERFPMEVSVVGGEAHIAVDAVDKEDQFVNGLSSQAQIRQTRRNGTLGDPISTTLEQTAPGRYEAIVPLSNYGAYVVEATHQQNSHTIALSESDITYPYPREYQRFEPDEAILRSLAQLSDGTYNGAVNQPYKLKNKVIRSTTEIWTYPIGLAIVLFLLDIMVRRVRYHGPAKKGQLKL